MDKKEELSTYYRYYPLGYALAVFELTSVIEIYWQIDFEAIRIEID